ncbi:hypothetical protein XENOCAPTIV_023356 [Xenoophorus captivus]|uniref:Uncharacterized protein n=1 Tax=Xenoophorus captivus TaxID=1517983 RepID=A0ABV0SJ84_9TELE
MAHVKVVEMYMELPRMVPPRCSPATYLSSPPRMWSRSWHTTPEGAASPTDLYASAMASTTHKDRVDSDEIKDTKSTGHDLVSVKSPPARRNIHLVYCHWQSWRNEAELHLFKLQTSGSLPAFLFLSV